MKKVFSKHNVCLLSLLHSFGRESICTR